MADKEYLFEETETFPYVCKMQNGNSPIDVNKFINYYNDSVAILRASSKFYNQITTAFDSSDSLNKFIRLTEAYFDQGKGLLLALRNNGKPLYMPNHTYFSEHYDEMMKTTKPNTPERLRQTKILCKQCVDSLNFTLEKNRENGRGLPIKTLDN